MSESTIIQNSDYQISSISCENEKIKLLVGKLRGALEGSRAELGELSSAIEAAEKERACLEKNTANVKRRISGLESNLAEKERIICSTKDKIARLQGQIQQVKSSAQQVRNGTANLVSKYNQDINKLHRDVFVSSRHDGYKLLDRGEALDNLQLISAEPGQLAAQVADLCYQVNPKLRQFQNGVCQVPDITCLEELVARVVGILQTSVIASVTDESAVAEKLDLQIEIDLEEWQEMLRY